VLLLFPKDEDIVRTKGKQQVKIKTALMVVAAGLTVLPAFGQEEFTHKQEVTVLGFGSFLKGTTSNGVRNDAENTGGALASYRYFFNQHHGVEVNYAFSSFRDSYGSASSLTSHDTRSHEISAAYVFRFSPIKRITPFVEAGIGGLVFDPKNFSGASTQTRASFIYGGGADLSLSSHLYVRAEYRGLVYNSPTWGVTALNGLDRVTHAAEPALGIGYRF
jgi:outer membrane immunogenic protein